MSRFSVENFSSHSAEKGRMGTLYSFSNFKCRKNLCFRGLCLDFPSKTFCLTVPKLFVEEAFYAVFQKISGSEKLYG